jgi:para-aminobenzoate synthetase component 1
VSLPTGQIAVVQDGQTTLLATEPSEVVCASGAEAFRALEGLRSGWWAGFLSYDLGRQVEHVASRGLAGPALPDVLLARFERRTPLEAPSATPTSSALGPWTSSLDRPAWDTAVATIHEHLAAGDCYQVNLTRQLVADGEADAEALYLAALARHPAPHAALLRFGGVSVVSLSPEQFLRRDGLDVATRPIKGTARDRATLDASAKDRAENVMIVDLARNDLGRVCEFGTIHVPSLFAVEEHPGLFHLSSEVRGTLRDGTSAADLVRATFPPASITGCPKPRVMQIIENLEPVRRGVYCGAIGFIDVDNDVMDLNVAIRTFTMTEGRTCLGVGGGIVADSDAGAEWEETELKARRLLALTSG